MLVTISRWLVMFGLDCERCSDQDRLREGKESEGVYRLRHLEEEKTGWKERTKCRQELPREKCFLYIRCMMPRKATISALCFIYSLKTFPPSQGYLDIYLYLCNPPHPQLFLFQVSPEQILLTKPNQSGNNLHLQWSFKFC